MKNQYRKAMEATYIACIALSGLALVAITLMIPAGVFMRYVMNDPLQWPEPASVVERMQSRRSFCAILKSVASSVGMGRRG